MRAGGRVALSFLNIKAMLLCLQVTVDSDEHRASAGDTETEFCHFPAKKSPAELHKL